jgi:hypothetical protein
VGWRQEEGQPWRWRRGGARLVWQRGFSWRRKKAVVGRVAKEAKQAS